MDVFGYAQENLADLRVVNQDFEEIPYVLFARRAQKSRKWLTGRMTETGFVPGGYNQLIMDTGSEEALHNRVEVRLEESDFFAWVEVAVSDDLEEWRIVREKVPIYRFQAEGVSAWTLSYPESRSRWIRLRILYGDEQLQIESARVAEEVVEEAEYMDLPLQMGLLASDSSDSLWHVDTGRDNVAVSAVRFEAEQTEFHRVVRLSTSPDAEEWKMVGEGNIYRIHDTDKDDPWRTSLTVEFPEARGRYFQLTVLNRNDAPVQGLRPILQTTPHRVIWRQARGASYRLLYGNSRARAPRYDLSELTSRSELENSIPGRLGPEELNMGYVSPEPWTERHPLVLWLALVAAVLILGVLAIRSLKLSSPGDE
jgi:hypothetical protein